jgi:hypothetical protein
MPLIMFPLVVHTLDLVVSAAGIMSVRSTAAPGSNRVEDPYAVMKQGYAVCISLAVVGFGLATRLMLEVRPTPLHRLYPVCVHPLHHAAGQGARWALRTPRMHLCPLSTVSSAWDLASRMRRHQCACTRTNRVLPQHSSAHLAATPRGCVPTHSTRSLSARAQVPSAPGSWLHFFGCGLVGIATAYAFVWITQYYTDYKYKPVRTIAEASTTGVC